MNADTFFQFLDCITRCLILLFFKEQLIFLTAVQKGSDFRELFYFPLL